jgi:hypothetical protein
MSRFLDSSVAEGVFEKLALPGEGQTRALRLFHQSYFLRKEPGHIHSAGGRLAGFPEEEGMVPVDINDIAFGETLRAPLAVL